ncbi:MAG: major capsid protein, partial [Prevotella sp.]
MPPYFGEGYFPTAKKSGLDLKYIKGSSGLPISLLPSAFDAHAKLRDRIGISTLQTEMPFFREGFLITEQDRQDILRAQDSNDPYVAQALQNIYQDSQQLIAGANVIPERMRMQLLAPEDGNLGINITADGAAYEYNFDSDGSWKAKNYKALEGTAMWSDTANSDPL